MRRHRNAKIVATLGPASATEDMIRALFLSGVDVFRLNFSHGTHEAHRERLQQIRNVERSVGRPIGVLADMQGPKLRVGTFAEGPVTLVAGAAFRLDLDDRPGDATRACLPLGKPVIVATQMLESMIGSPVPTRAEASDVATAIYHGADAVMLSAESAAGKYPLEAVQMMDRILGEVDSDPHYRELLEGSQTKPQQTSADAICAAMNTIAGLLPVAAIVTYTTSGSTSLRAARERPVPPILSMTPSLATARRMALVWGVHSVQTPDVTDVAEMVDHACQCAVTEGFAKPGDSILISAGMPFGTPGATNLLRIAAV